MVPLEFLREEYDNVDRALQETLRYEYEPEESRHFYAECGNRLQRIKRQIAPGQIDPANKTAIAALLSDLGYIATQISLIERSRLGEFSWPFANELRKLAKRLLTDETFLGEKSEPIVQVVAEGHGYRIRNEEVTQSPSSGKRFSVIFFPRPLKHHVLLHAIFGHELGHAALETSITNTHITLQVVPALSQGFLKSDESASEWLARADAPPEQSELLNEHKRQYREDFKFVPFYRGLWLKEFICDLCGLLLFGPAFLAAHRAIIEPPHAKPLTFDPLEPTHPPYALRHKTLLQAMRILHWHKTITVNSHQDVRDAEQHFLGMLADDPFPDWAKVYSDVEIENAIEGLRWVLGELAYTPPTADNISILVERLKRSLPPIIDSIDDKGNPQLVETDFRHILHAAPTRTLLVSDSSCARLMITSDVMMS